MLDSRPSVIPAVPVSLVICNSVSPVFLRWISFEGFSVPIPRFVTALIDPDEVISPTLYVSVPVPTVPLDSLLTNSYQPPAWEKYPLPVAWTWANKPW